MFASLDVVREIDVRCYLSWVPSTTLIGSLHKQQLQRTCDSDPPKRGKSSSKMIGLKGRMNVIDNSGGLIAECINVLKAKSAQGMATVGDEVVVVINKARPISQAANSPSSSAAASASNIQKVRRGDVRRAVIVRTRFPVGRPDGRNVRFDDNACVLLNNKGEMIGTRVNGVVAAELRDVQGGPAGSGGRWGKILGLAGKVV